jgi:hypothetical protein
MKLRKQPLALAVALAVGGLSGGAHAQALCRPDNTVPFTASAVNPISGFADSVTDSEGVSLIICTDSVDGQGNPPPCFFDPPIANNAQSQATGFGAEGFWFLSDNLFTTTGPAAIDALVVGATEAAYLTETPRNGDQFPFTRLRIRIDVTVPGIYTVLHPWGEKRYTVNAVVDDRGRDLKREINDTIDVEFAPNGSRTGSVGPWLRWDPAVGPAAPAGYIGDGLTPHTVVGSACGRNHVQVLATRLDGTTPLAIDPTDADGDGSTASYTNRLFTVAGKIAPRGITPLNVTNAYYSRGTGQSFSVFATAPTTATVTATPGGALATDGQGRFFLNVAQGGTLPASVTVTAANAAQGNEPAPPQTVLLKDLVTVGSALATCSGTPRSCSLTVNASSSDQVQPPQLNLVIGSAAYPLTNGSVTVTGLTVLPAAATVTSAAGGTGSQPVTVQNP